MNYRFSICFKTCKIRSNQTIEIIKTGTDLMSFAYLDPLLSSYRKTRHKETFTFQYVVLVCIAFEMFIHSMFRN